MFKSVPPKPNTAQMEDVLARFWKTWRIRERCEEERRGGGEFVYYENPPSPNSKPDFPQAINRAFSDLFLRYKTMRGYHILRRSGWQAHGLSVELLAARQLGISGKNQIEECGIANFNQACRNTLDYYAPNWERMNDRLAYWVNPQEAYLTITNEYIESVWWAIKSLWDKGLLYQALKVMPYCPSCGVHLSKHEIKQSDEEVNEPLLCVRFPLVNGPGTSLLVLTKAPWSLIGNVAVAVHPEAEYITIEQEAPGGGLEHLVVAQKSAVKIFGETSLKVVDKFKGRKLKGEAYFPLYTFLLPQKTAHTVIADDFVNPNIGTGLVHIAPLFNEQDLLIAQEYDLPLLDPITETGAFIPDVRPWSGKFVKDANAFIIQDLDARGLLFNVKTISQTEPQCSYCGSPLLDYARNEWFVRISQKQEELFTLSQQTIKYSEWDEETYSVLRVNEFFDKPLSSNHFWGAPLPIWECQTCHHQVCVGSVEELSQLTGVKQSDLDLHRPFVDDVFLICPECQAQLIRVSELIHPWFESACMPFASWHYPFENQAVLEKQFPADLICVNTDEADNWLVDLHAINGILFSKASFIEKIQSDLCAHKQEMGKDVTRGEYLQKIVNEFGGDIFRWHVFDCWQPRGGKPGNTNLLNDQALKKAHNIINLIWYAYSFFINQANLDDWTPQDIPQKPKYKISDRWLRSELHESILEVTTGFDFFSPQKVVGELKEFIHKLCHWYIPQSEYRFLKRKMDADKAAAYATLYEALTTLCRLCAPVIPFLAEEMYQNLAGNNQSQGFISVHLADWPIADLAASDERLMSDMVEVMNLTSLGHTARKTANIPLYQPLSEIIFLTGMGLHAEALGAYCELLKNELNVKEVKFLEHSKQVNELLANSQYVLVSKGMQKAALMTQLTPELIDDGIAQQMIRRIKILRKQAGLGRGERVSLHIKAAPTISEAVYKHRQSFLEEVDVVEISEPPAEKNNLSQFEINGKSILIGIEKIH